MILKYKVDKLPFLFYNTCKVGDIMYLYRAVNDWDIYFNMINNGFVSKEIIDDFFKNSDNMNSENKFSLIEKHQKEILKIAGFYQEYVNSLFSSIERKPSSLSAIPTADNVSEFSLTASFKRSEHIVLIELDVLPRVL